MISGDTTFKQVDGCLSYFDLVVLHFGYMKNSPMGLKLENASRMMSMTLLSMM